MKEKWLQLLVIGCFVLCFVSCGKENIAANKCIIIPEQESVETVQYNATKFPAQRLQKETLSSLIQDLEALQPVTGECPELGNAFQTVCFRYENGTKDVFLFWKQDGKWYVCTQNGNIYQNADFLQNYMDIEEVDSQMIIHSEDIFLNTDMQNDRGYDEGYEFVFRLQNAVNTGYSLEEAEKIVRIKAMREEAAYQYAVSLKLEPTEEELKARMEHIIEEVKKLSNYEEIKVFYAKQGSTLESEVYRREENIKRKCCIERLYRKIYDDFRCGEDTLDGQVYNTVDDYWNAYLDKIVNEQKIDFSEMEGQLKKALKYVS